MDNLEDSMVSNEEAESILTDAELAKKFLSPAPKKMSTRIKTKGEAEPEEVQNLFWSELEKIALIDFLHKYGHSSKYTLKGLKTKSDSQIKNFIRTRMRQARLMKQERIESNSQSRGRNYYNENSVTPLEEWIKFLSTACVDGKLTPESSNSQTVTSKLLPAAFFIMSLFESHPDPKDCEGINFRDVYEFLYNTLLGYPSRMLSKPTANFLFFAFYDACKSYRKRGLASESLFLNSIRDLTKNTSTSGETTPVKLKTYPGKRKHNETDDNTEQLKKIPKYMSELMKISLLNPFNMRADDLEIPIDKSSEIAEK